MIRALFTTSSHPFRFPDFARPPRHTGPYNPRYPHVIAPRVTHGRFALLPVRGGPSDRRNRRTTPAGRAAARRARRAHPARGDRVGPRAAARSMERAGRARVRVVGRGSDRQDALRVAVRSRRGPRVGRRFVERGARGQGAAEPAGAPQLHQVGRGGVVRVAQLGAPRRIRADGVGPVAGAGHHHAEEGRGGARNPQPAAPGRAAVGEPGRSGRRRRARLQQHPDGRAGQRRAGPARAVARFAGGQLSRSDRTGVPPRRRSVPTDAHVCRSRHGSATRTDLAALVCESAPLLDIPAAHAAVRFDLDDSAPDHSGRHDSGAAGAGESGDQRGRGGRQHGRHRHQRSHG